MPKKPFEPNFRTPVDLQSKAEAVKRNQLYVDREVAFQFWEDVISGVSADVETLAKSYGIYMEFDRAVRGRPEDFFFMIRITNPGGGPISREQWRLLDELSEKYCKNPHGNPSLRFTTRQTVQLHWLKKEGVRAIVKTMAEQDMRSINGCGDNTRNVMCCPLAQFSDIFNARTYAVKMADYFQLPLEPYIKVFMLDPEKVRRPGQSFQYGPNMLNRKFKIGFSQVHRNQETGLITPDNCIEMRTNDLGVAPLVEGDKVTAFQLYVGGGQGERNNYPSMASLSEPLGIVTEEQLLPALDAVVATHQDWGDRENRHWARLKYVLKKQGIDWFRDQVTSRLGFPLHKPNPEHDIGARDLHFGWNKQPSNGKWSFCAYIENGRIIDGGANGNLKTMIREIMNKYDTSLMVTPNQDVMFTNIEENQKEDFVADLKKHGWGQRNGKDFSQLRLNSGACVGRDSCRLTYTDSEKLEPELMDELEKMGWGALNESIGITGCERQCFRPATKTIGLVGSGMDRYMFKLFGDKDANTQGKPLIDSTGENLYLRSVKREELTTVLDALFKYYKENAQNDEDMGAFHRRIGADAIIAYLKENPATAGLMEKPFNTNCIID